MTMKRRLQIMKRTKIRLSSTTRSPCSTCLTFIGLCLVASSMAWSSPPLIGRRNPRVGEKFQSKLRLARNDEDETYRDSSSIWATDFSRVCSTLIYSVAILFSAPPEALASTVAVPSGQRYWSIMSTATPEEKVIANEALLDFAVGTINTQFYDNTGGAYFAPRDFYSQWKLFKRVASGEIELPANQVQHIPTDIHLDSRDGAERGLRWLAGSMNDPFSKYLTRDELRKELQSDSNGFLGTGAIVDPPQIQGNSHQFSAFFGPHLADAGGTMPSKALPVLHMKKHDQKKFLTITRAANLPVVTAVAPDSPAERAGLVVGDRIVAVGDQDFLGWTRLQVEKRLATKYNQEDYFGQAELTVAKPVYYAVSASDGPLEASDAESNLLRIPVSRVAPRSDIVIGYRQTRVRLPITASGDPVLRTPSTDADSIIVGGDSIVHYQLLTSKSGSIFDHLYSDDATAADYRVGYIRLTRFSKASTTGYVAAVQALEKAGAHSYILDLRNNYGGVLQEAMLTASTLLRDPHAILCYTMNARGGFTPHDAEEYIVDKRYPGYLLSSEQQHATIDQVQRETPAMFVDNGIAWDPPSSYASLHEQVTKRGIRRISYVGDISELLDSNPILKQQFRAQKKVVVLINEGTASAAEVFAAALHDNARAVALVGTKSYGKGLIQHTFPMPDGGGLRLSVAEYLTPALRHVTTVGGARYDRDTGELVGGGILPDILCESKQGIPRNIRADLCVGVALDALEEAEDNNADDITSIRRTASEIGEIPSQLIVSNRGKK